MANVPDDSKEYFSQTELTPPAPPEINIVPSPTGSQVEDGSLSSPNFRHLQSGWRISSDGTAEFQNVIVAGVAVSNIGTFGGDGSDGVLNLISGTETLDVGGERIFVKNYSSLSIASGATLTISNKHVNGTFLILKVQGDCTIQGTVDMSGMGGSAGTGAVVQTGSGSGGSYGTSIIDEETTSMGGGGGNGAGLPGSAGVGFAQSYTLTPYKFLSGRLAFSCGSGGGGGGAGTTAPGGDWGEGADGGNGGGVIWIECNGIYSFTGTLDVSGENGSDAVDTNGVGDAGSSGGGGGGGSAGQIFVLYNTLGVDSGTYSHTNGAGGAGGDANGSVSSGNSGSGGGGGGGFDGAGGAGGAGLSSGDGGNAGSAGAGGGGGGGSGANDDDSGGPYNGGAGGAGGTSNASTHICVTQNKYF